MAKRYRMTARRRAALKKAQLASARKRSRGKKIKRAAVVGGLAAGVLGAGVARHKLSGSSFSKVNHPTAGKMTGKVGGTRKPSYYKSRNVNKNGKVTGYSVGRHSGKKGPLGDASTRKYEHKKLTATMIGNKITSRSPRAAMAGRQLNYKTRAMRGKMNPNIPMYQGQNVGAFGAYGKRMGNMNNYVQKVGGKVYAQKDIFGHKARTVGR